MEAKKLNNTPSKVVVKKVISAGRQQVFEAWTNPELMKHWFTGGKGTAKATVDLKVGGKYTNEMLMEEKGTCEKEGKATDQINIKSYMHSGEYLEIKAPECLVFTWNSPSVQNTKVTVELKEAGTGTEVTITHELHSEEDCKGHNQGWNNALENLAQFLR